MTGLYCLFQAGQKPLLLFIPLLHFLLLLFKYLSIILENVGVGGRRHNNTKEKVKTSLFCLYIVDLGTITGFFR